MQEISALTTKIAGTVRPTAHSPALMGNGSGKGATVVTAGLGGGRVTLDQLDDAHHPKVAEAIAAARAWASRSRDHHLDASLVLVASPVMLPDGKPDLDRTGYGCGKTHIARAILWSIYLSDDAGRPVAPCGRFFEANAAIAALDQDVFASDLVGSAPIVVIDDVGTEQVIPYTAADEQAEERRRRYFKIINHCYTAGVSMVLTANMTLGALEQHVGGRAWSRLQEMAPKNFMIDLTGVPDHRRKVSGRGEPAPTGRRAEAMPLSKRIGENYENET